MADFWGLWAFRHNRWLFKSSFNSWFLLDFDSFLVWISTNIIRVQNAPLTVGLFTPLLQWIEAYLADTAPVSKLLHFFQCLFRVSLRNKRFSGLGSWLNTSQWGHCLKDHNSSPSRMCIWDNPQVLRCRRFGHLPLRLQDCGAQFG